jgi:hypothetical protein
LHSMPHRTLGRAIFATLLNSGPTKRALLSSIVPSRYTTCTPNAIKFLRICNHNYNAGTAIDSLKDGVRNRSNFSGAIGRSRTRVPVAWNTAFALAGATPISAVSPIPFSPNGDSKTLTIKPNDHRPKAWQPKIAFQRIRLTAGYIGIVVRYRVSMQLHLI